MKLQIAAFTVPVPIPGTHERAQQFHVEEGWDIERDEDGDVYISRGDISFGTDGVTSWRVLMPTDPRPSDSTPTGVRKAFKR